MYTSAYTHRRFTPHLLKKSIEIKLKYLLPTSVKNFLGSSVVRVF